MAVRPGFEPGQSEPKSLVLPLHHRTKYALMKLWLLKKIFFHFLCQRANKSVDSAKKMAQDAASGVKRTLKK